MKINDFTDKVRVKHTRDIKPFFKLEREFDINTSKIKGCLNCGNESNYFWYAGHPWEGTQHCWICNRLNVVYYTDAMGGNPEDHVFVYKEI